MAKTCLGLERDEIVRLMPFEKLHRTLVLLCRGAGLEGTKVSTFACLRVLFPRIQPVAARGEFSDHRYDISVESFKEPKRRVSCISTSVFRPLDWYRVHAIGLAMSTRSPKGDWAQWPLVFIIRTRLANALARSFSTGGLFISARSDHDRNQAVRGKTC